MLPIRLRIGSDNRTHPRRGKAAGARGVKFGRKPKLTAAQIDHARELIDNGESRQLCCRPPDRGDV
jgi:hypothetical protein